MSRKPPAAEVALPPATAAWLKPDRLPLDVLLGGWALLVAVTWLGSHLLDALSAAAAVGR